MSYSYAPRESEKIFAHGPEAYPTFDLTFMSKGMRHKGFADLANFIVRKGIDRGILPSDKVQTYFELRGDLGTRTIGTKSYTLYIDGRAADLTVDDLELRTDRTGKAGCNPRGAFFKGQHVEPRDPRRKDELVALALIPRDYEKHRSDLPEDVLLHPPVAASVIFGDYEENLRAATQRSGLHFTGRLTN